MGLISRVSSRTYRKKNLVIINKMADGDQKKKSNAVDAVTTQDLDKLSGMEVESNAMASTEELFKTLENFYKRQHETREKENARIIELKKVAVEKDHVSEVMKHWDLNRLEATTILKEHGGDINKAMLHLATN